MEITRDTLNYSSPPIGFMFTSKTLTSSAKVTLSAYWGNRINSKEAKEDYLNMMAEGNLEYKDMIHWYNKYTISYQRCEACLLQQRFIRKIGV